ncbi:phage portal protein, lambda family [Desulfobacula phenolica]|uniref:Phage portal protein, lambda family n=2 Tax=Desulfobacula phenolica TaxID=90732 RepID=A0A1H2I371_9BACT|nr:phage portal protein, lambda family [Desulfobacula phenolica]
MVASAIGVFAPGAAINYMRRRQALHSYAAASNAGPNKAWLPSNKSADELIKTDHKLMRARARSLTRDSSHVSGAIRKICNNVVFKGIHPQANLRTLNGDAKDRLNSRAESQWKKWAKAVDFHEKENLVLRHWWHDGELFAHYYFDEDLLRKGIIPLGLELLECDHLDAGKSSLTDGERIKQGIQYTANGKTDGYWLFREHPGDNTWLTMNRSQFYSAQMINHLFIRERISQNRGVSWLASIIMEMRDFSEYQNAERIAKRLVAAFGLFVTTPYPENLGSFNPFGGDGKPLTVDSIPDYMESGRIQILPPGMTVESPSSDRPGATYEPYTKTSLRGASTGFNMSYEAYSNDYTDASYSSARSATLEERRGYQVQQFLLANKFHQDAWERLWLMNRLSRTEDLPEEIPVVWQMPGWPWVDPFKDSKAAEQDLKNGLTSRHKLCMERGIDYDEINNDLQRERADVFSLNTQTGGNDNAGTD